MMNPFAMEVAIHHICQELQVMYSLRPFSMGAPMVVSIRLEEHLDDLGELASDIWRWSHHTSPELPWNMCLEEVEDARSNALETK